MFFILSDIQIENLIDIGMKGKADYVEVYMEHSNSSAVNLLDNRVIGAKSGLFAGVGIRLMSGVNSVYVYSDDTSYENLCKLCEEASKAINGDSIYTKHELEKLCRSRVYEPQINPLDLSKSDYVTYLKNAGSYAKNYSDKINKVTASIDAIDKSYRVCNSRGINRENSNVRIRMSLSVIASDGSAQQVGSRVSPGTIKGFEFLNEYPIIEKLDKCCESAIRMLSAGYAPSGKMPVVIGNGFGGVIFHEACGHALEATSVGINSSCFNDKIGKQIASSIVTARDDARLEGEWGSYTYDSEGTDSSNLLLIENGICKNYLVDELGSRRMPGFKSTGCSRRQNYTYAPTSRMSNTYIANGTEDPMDIIADTEYGLYAADMGGGSVDTASGEFNFAVNEGYIIRNGKICEPVRGATLIGKGPEVLMNIDRVGNDLAHAQGVCGSLSGNVPTNVGQPTIRVQSILVGGRD